MMLSTSDWPLVCFIMVSSTEHLYRFSSGCSSLLSSSLVKFPLISIICDWKSDHVPSLHRHHDVSTHGRRGQETKLKFRIFCLKLSCQGQKIYIKFLGIHNIITYSCHTSAPLSLSVPLSGFLTV